METRDTGAVAENNHVHDDRNFHYVLDEIQRGMYEVIHEGPIFRTDVKDLFKIYINNLPVLGDTEEEKARARKEFDCSTCKLFFKRFGGLVTVDHRGDLTPIMWRTKDAGFYQPGIDAVRNHIVAHGKIISAYFSSHPVWGERQTGEWVHYAVSLPVAIRKDFISSNPNASMQASIQRLKTVMNALREIKLPVIKETLRILKAENVARAERFIAPIQWLHDLYEMRNQKIGGQNLLWKNITSAPEGFCHPKGAVTWTLMEDVEKGIDLKIIQRKFSAMVDPLKFQRAQVAPSSGTILQAEKLIAQLGIAKSLERRYARLDEVRKLWSPTPAKQEPKSEGVFGHLKTKDAPTPISVQLDPKTMTWEKFAEKILPTAQRIQLNVPEIHNFVGVLTAQHADAPPIYKWDKEDDRYPISHYVYNKGSRAGLWNLSSSQWVEVTAVCPAPSVVEGIETQFIFVLEGAINRQTDQGNALFMECLRSDLFSVRSVIEAYSKSAVIGGIEEASANGIAINKNVVDIHIRVFDGSHWNVYFLDRFE